MRSVYCLLGWLSWTGVVAQAQPGLVRGTVLDAETGERLGRATIVALSHDTVGVIADLRGEFRLKLGPGSYRVRVSMVGYAAAEQQLMVHGGDTLQLVVRLYPAVRQMHGVVVEARRQMGSVEAALSVRRSATAVMDVTAAEQMRISGDADAGQVLRRISSVAVMEGKYLMVRGTNERYSTVLLDGAAVAMTEPDRRALLLELFPTEILEQVAVTKAPTAELPAATGAVVGFQTTELPERSFWRLSIGSPYIVGLSFHRQGYVHYPGGPRDWLGWDDRWRRLPAQAPNSRQEMNALLQAVWNPYDTTGARQRWVALGRAFNSEIWRRDTGMVNLLPDFHLAGGWRMQTGEQSEFGGVGVLTYSRSATVNDVLWRGLLYDRSLLFSHEGIESVRKTTLGALLNLGYRFSGEHQLRVQSLLSRSFTDRFLFLQGADLGYQFLQMRHYVYHPEQYQLWNLQLSGHHALDGYAFEWALGRSEGRQQQPDFRRLRYQRQLSGDPAEPFIAEIPATQQGDGTRAGRLFTDLLEKTFSARLAGRLPLAFGTLRVGFTAEQRWRRFTARSFALIQARGGAYNVDFTLPPEELLRPENFRADGLGISEDTKLSDSYRATEQVWSTFATVELPLELGALPARIAFGVRAELAQQGLSSHLVNEQPVETNRRWLSWLPTVTASLQLRREEMFLRGGLYRSVTRPVFRELAPFAFFDVAEQELVQGNPLLTPADAWNAELRWEWYPTVGELLSVGVFTKRIANALEETIFPQQSELTRTFANAVEPAQLWGIELEVRKRLVMLGTWAQGVVLFGNLSLVHGRVGVRSGGLIVERPLWGQSPYGINLGVLWQTPWKGELSLVWNRIGSRIVKVAQVEQYSFPDPHVYEQPRDLLDLVYRQPLLAGLTVSLSAKNLLGLPVRWEQGGVEVFRRLEPRTLNLSIGYRSP